MKITLWCSILILLGSILLAIYIYPEVRIERAGSLVKMRIEFIDDSCDAPKGNHLARFGYRGLTYVRKIPAGYCDNHQVGDLVDMKYLEGSNKILFPYETEDENIISLIILSLIGMVMLTNYLFTAKK